MKKNLPRFDAVTVTLNPAVDCTISIPGFTPGAVNRVESVRNTAGGKGVNVASSLASDGRSVAATGFLGRDNAGIFETLFERKKIADRFVRIAGETRTGIKITDPEKTGTTDINFPGISPTPGDVETLRHEIESLDAAWYVLGGSIPPGVSPDVYRTAVAFLKFLGRNVVVDTSDEPLRQVLEASPTLIKPNIHELEALLGEPLRDEQAVVNAARSLIARGIAFVVVSMGEKGACFVTAHEAVIARPPRIEVLSTVGAGDAMVAGIVSAQLDGLPLAACARRATAFSIEALTRPAVGAPGFGAAIAAIADQVTLA